MYLAKDYIMKGETSGNIKKLLEKYLNNIKSLEGKVKKLNVKGDGAKKAVDIILSLK